MAVELNPGVGGDQIATDTLSGEEVQLVKITHGNSSSTSRARAADPLPVLVYQQDKSIDAFGRFRVSAPQQLFASKLLFGKETLIWDESVTNGSGNALSSHSTVNAAVTMHVENGDTIIRQSFRRMPYQPGRSQQVMMTGILSNTTGVGVRSRIGYFDANNGVFFEQDNATVYVVIRKNGSDTRVAQVSWNVDALDGTGESGVTADWTKCQIFVVDFEWLGVGTVRFGVGMGNTVQTVHKVEHANSASSVYMSTPNLPVRYEAVSTSTTFEVLHMCSTVASEGGAEAVGRLRWISTGSTALSAASVGTVYAVVGVRIGSSYTGVEAAVEKVNMLITSTNDEFEWLLLANPTVAGTFTYSSVSGSSLERAIGVAANTVTGGTEIDGGFGVNNSSVDLDVHNSLAYLGEDISGTPAEIVLCVRPASANLTVLGGVLVREAR